MSELLKDPMFFYAIAFLAIVWIGYRYGRKPALQMLDDQILEIRNELEEARKLRAEAEESLKQYKVKAAAAMSEAELIVKHAKDEAARLQVWAEADLKKALERHEQQAAERIRLAEAAAIADVRAATVDLAVKIARETLSASSNDPATTKILDKAIAGLSSQPTNKAA